HHEADDREPAFSPEGSKIVFHSDRDGGGIYVMSLFGGEAKLLVKHGRRPRFSPDGSLIVFWDGPMSRGASDSEGDTSSVSGGKIYVVASTGGVPRQLRPDFPTARYPVWSPDGRYILFAGVRDPLALPNQRYDWWVTPLDGGPVIRTGAFDTFRRHNLSFYYVPS